MNKLMGKEREKQVQRPDPSVFLNQVKRRGFHPKYRTLIVGLLSQEEEEYYLIYILQRSLELIGEEASAGGSGTRDPFCKPRIMGGDFTDAFMSFMPSSIFTLLCNSVERH